MAANLVATLVVFPLLHGVATGLRITEVEVPRYLVVGQKATLRCHLALEGEVLYSLKWWKDGKQFYQYIPQNKPPAVVFTVPGITINPARSGLNEVELLDVQSSSTGTYRCEVVAEAPTFNTHVMSANMTIVDTPDTKPRVSGLEAAYRDGEKISLNCTSLRSRPPAQLTWSINGQEIAQEHLVRYSAASEGDPALHTTTLGLSLTARTSLFTDGALELRCSATVHVYEWSTDVTLHLDNVTYSQPHHLPTLQQTDAASSILSSCILVLCSLLTLCLCRRT
ncbi:nephrin [Procambarus clarkii]|uniref:nephrin n=1 Tax=Procambarus clarkii TaxID=6728 RepID=UPI0037437793